MKPLSLAVSLAVLLAANAALADMRVAILPVGGPGGSKAEAALRKGLGKRSDVEVIPAGAVKSAMGKHGRKVEALAKALKADAVLVSLTSKSGKNMKVNVGVYDADGERVGGNGWTVKGNKYDSVQKSAWSELGSAIKKAAKAGGGNDAPAREEKEEEEEAPAVASRKVVKPSDDAPKKDEESDDESESGAKEDDEKEASSSRTEVASADERSSSSRRSSSDDESDDSTTLSSARDSDSSNDSNVDAEIGMHAFTRNFSYNQPLYGSLASYKLTSGPAVAGGVTFLLGDLAGDNFARNIGIGVLGETAFGIGSQAQDGSRVGTTAYAFDVGPRVRIPLGNHAVGVGAGYGSRVFAVANTEDPVLNMVPDVSYRYISARAQGRFMLGEQFSVNANVAYLHLLGTGELGTDKYFPRLSGAGIEAAAFIGYEVAPKWEVRVGVDMTRFFFALKPEPGDANVAGGATDQFFAGTARIAYRM